MSKKRNDDEPTEFGMGALDREVILNPAAADTRPRYIALDNLEGRVKAGETVALDDATAAVLVQLGRVSLVGTEIATPNLVVFAEDSQ